MSVLQKDTVTVEPLYVGICGSDMQKLQTNDSITFERLGHEIVGSIVYESSKKTVVINPLISCADCMACRTNQSMFCERLKVFGRDERGGFGGVLDVPVTNVSYWPETTANELGVLVDPYAVVLHTMTKLKYNLDHYATMLIEGDGTIALINALHVRLYCKNITNIVVVCSNQVRADRLQEWYGAMFEDAIIHFVTTAEGVYDVAIEAVGRAQNITINHAAHHVKPQGEIIGIGVYPLNTNIAVDLRHIMFKELTVTGVNSYNPPDFQKAIKLIEKHQDIFHNLIGKIYPRIEWQAALAEARHKSNDIGQKIIISFA